MSLQIELRKIPGVDVLCAQTRLPAKEGAPLVRSVLKEIRHQVLAGAPCPDLSDLVQRVRAEKIRLDGERLRPVINGTGISIHTNLGRSPLPEEIFSRLREINTTYTNLELDLMTGERGKRGSSIQRQLKALTGSEAALVVNNNAAAVWLILAALAVKKEVICSRGELVQIGGGFRVPDLMTQSGAKLVEVGTTNITGNADYTDAISEETAILMKVHRSNFAMIGHSEEVHYDELAQLAETANVASVFDLGSGAFTKWQGHNHADEPTVREVLSSGVDLVSFSGDKLVGGVQAGFICGKEKYIKKLRKHPLMRAMRPGKLVMSAVQETLQYYVEDRHKDLPVWQMIEVDPIQHAGRTQKFVDELKDSGVQAQIKETSVPTGGGAAPGFGLPTTVLCLSQNKYPQLATRLRQAPSPVVTRVENNEVMIDLRTVFPNQETLLMQSILVATQSQEVL